MKYPNVAGTYYPSDARKLQETVDTFLAEADDGNLTFDGRIRAIIVPHSGYLHSGKVAAQGFSLLQKEAFAYPRRNLQIIIIAPSHHKNFIGMATASFKHYRTPLGDVVISPLPTLFPAHPGIFAEEHSLEVQLPFLQRIFEETPFTVKPLLIGNSDPDALVRALDTTVIDPNTLLVVTTDLSHFLSEKEATKQDVIICRAIEHLDEAVILESDICGKVGVLALVKLAKQLNLKARCVKYDNSAISSGNNNRVVGYGAFVLYEELTTQEV